jgi:hypothetical protein
MSESARHILQVANIGRRPYPSGNATHVLTARGAGGEIGYANFRHRLIPQDRAQLGKVTSAAFDPLRLMLLGAWRYLNKRGNDPTPVADWRLRDCQTLSPCIHAVHPVCRSFQQQQVNRPRLCNVPAIDTSSRRGGSADPRYCAWERSAIGAQPRGRVTLNSPQSRNSE